MLKTKVTGSSKKVHKSLMPYDMKRFLLVQPLHVITRIFLSNVSSCAFIARLYAKNLTRYNKTRFWKLLLDLSLCTFLKNCNLRGVKKVHFAWVHTSIAFST